ncbi:MAG: M12 family metallopeptidase, partial [Verrucomicrobiota bacterium]
MLALLGADPLLHAEKNSANWNVVQLDRLLASVPSGEKLVKVGDMGILVAHLRAWRNQLVGNSSDLAFDGGTPTWPGGILYYTFDDSVSALHQKAFLDGANEWAAFANLQFVARTTQPNYFTVIENPSLSGGFSAVGMVGGQQFLQIGPSSWNHGTVCHELGHTLGLVHEQQRSDRDSFVTILTENIIPGTEDNFVKLGNSNNQGAYDFLSIMHYARNTLSIDSDLDTIEPLPAFSQFLDLMGHGDPILSPLDRAGMAAIYGNGPAFTSVVSNTRDSGPGSLRTAIYFGFDHPGTTITFNIPTSDAGFSNGVFNILPTDQLPGLWNATVIDGGTEPTNSNPNGPEILLDGSLAQLPSVFASGLHFRGTNCAARSLIINLFSGYGILLDGTNTTGNAVSGCYLSVDSTGAVAMTNRLTSIAIEAGASGNVIGGTNAAARNVISGSVSQGMFIRGVGTKNNSVQGNYIGLNAAGNAPLPNGFSGVGIFGGAQSNVIGGTVMGAGNIIS